MTALHIRLAGFAKDGEELELDTIAFSPRAVREWSEIVGELLGALESIMVEYPDMCADNNMCDDPHTASKIYRAREAIARARSG